MILDNKNKIKKIVLGMASSISIAIALIVPAEHYYTGYGYLRKLNEDKAVYTATELSNFVFMNPDSWDIQEHRYTAIIESHRIEGGNNVALYDINGDYIFSTETKLDEPVVGMKREIFNGNEVVGYLYSEYSLNEILWEVLYSIIVGIMLAVIVFVVLYKIPIKALSLALNELDEALAALVSEVEQKEGALKKAKNLSDALYDMAMHDSLTGLPNRNMFHDRLEQSISLAERQGARLAIVMMDLNKFKDINDTLGHHAGDKLLITTARKISSTIRKSDTIARLGGDEFALIVHLYNKPDSAINLCKKLSSKLKEPVSIGENDLKIYVSGSFGIAYYPEHGRDGDTLLHKADTAMYMAKQKETNAINVYTVEDDKNTPGKMEMIQRFISSA